MPSRAPTSIRSVPVSFRALAALAVAAFAVSCGGGDNGPAAPPPPPDPSTILATVNVAPSTAEVPIGGTQQFNAAGVSQANTPLSITPTWTSSAPAVATVDANGLVTAVDAGSARITATSGGVSGEAQVTVPEPGPPAVPSGLAAQAISGTEIRLTWTDNSSDEDEFIVLREIDETFSEIARVEADVTEYVDSGLSEGETYRYRVRASNARGESESSPFAQATTLVPLRITTDSLRTGIVGNDYFDVLLASGGPNAQYQWEVVAGELPTGVELAATGVLTGVITAGGDYDFTARVTSGEETVTGEFRIATITPQADATFDIELEYLVPPSQENREVFDRAAERWGEVITQGLVEVIGGLPQNGCGVDEDAYIDDVRILVRLDSIDGPGSVLGSAGPCLIRSESGLTIAGTMTFDTADVAGLRENQRLEAVILHEMGHVIGIGTLWELFEYVEGGCLQGDDAVDLTTTFTGPRTNAAYAALGGTGAVPIYNSGDRPGSDCGHWDESVFTRELMTPFLGASPNPMSSITIESLGDMGYTVDSQQAEDFSLIPPAGVSVIRHDPNQGEGLFMELLKPNYIRRPDGRYVPLWETRQPGARR